jgi:hypothetical protein
MALEARKRQSLFNVIDLLRDSKIDLIFRKSCPFSEEEFGRRKQVVLQGFAIFGREHRGCCGCEVGAERYLVCK